MAHPEGIAYFLGIVLKKLCAYKNSVKLELCRKIAAVEHQKSQPVVDFVRIRLCY